jgi:hypothetical protein
LGHDANLARSGKRRGRPARMIRRGWKNGRSITCTGPIGVLAGTSMVPGGCLGILHDLSIHGAKIIQTWGALDQLGLVQARLVMPTVECGLRR